MATLPMKPTRLAPDRSALFAILIVVTATNAMANRMVASFDGGVIHAIATLLGISAALWLALYAVVALSRDATPEPVAPRDWIVASVAMLLAAIPLVSAGAAALFVVAAWLCLTTMPGSTLRRMAYVALAMSGPLLWGPGLQAMLGPEISRIEAAIIGTATGLPVDGNIFRSRDGATTFVVAGPCSALANISLSLLLLVTVSQLLDIALSRRLIPIALATVAATVAINSARIAMIGIYPDYYDFLHVGTGKELFAWATLLLNGAVIFIGLDRATRPRA